MVLGCQLLDVVRTFRTAHGRWYWCAAATSAAPPFPTSGYRPIPETLLSLIIADSGSSGERDDGRIVEGALEEGISRRRSLTGMNVYRTRKIPGFVYDRDLWLFAASTGSQLMNNYAKMEFGKLLLVFRNFLLLSSWFPLFAVSIARFSR